MLQEPEIRQESFLPRKEWEKKLEQTLLTRGATIFFLDVVGGGELAKQNVLASRIQTIINSIAIIYDQEKNGNIKKIITSGRHIKVQKRVPGSDEIIFFFENRLNKREILPLPAI